LTLSADPTVTPGNTGTFTLTPAVTAGKAKNAGIFNGTLSLISTPSNTQVGTETVTYQVNNFAAQTANYTGVGSFNGGGGATQSLTYGNLRVTATGGLSSTALAIRNTGGLTTAAAFTDQLTARSPNTLVGARGSPSPGWPTSAGSHQHHVTLHGLAATRRATGTDRRHRSTVADVVPSRLLALWNRHGRLIGVASRRKRRRPNDDARRSGRP
jgi:hypothetical protein